MATTSPPSSTMDASRLQFIQRGRRLWHESAPKKIAQTCQVGAAGEPWQAWYEYLQERKTPAPLAKLLPGKSWPLAWAVPEELLESGTVDWVMQFAPAGQKSKPYASAVLDSLEPWLAEAQETPANSAYALEALAVVHALPGLAAQVAPELWWELLEHLVQTAVEAEMQIDAKPLTGQLLSGELPLALAYLFPELRPCRDLAMAAKKNLSAGLVELLDGEGLPHGRHYHLLRPLLAVWTRAAALGAELFKGGGFTRDGATQYEWLVRNALRFTRHDGSLLLARSAADAWEPDLLAAAVALGGNEEDASAAIVSLPGSSPKEVKQITAAELPEAATNSEWAGLAVLRPDWTRRGPRLAIDYSTPQMLLELDLGAGVVLSGAWNFQIEVGGQPVESAGDWEELCWNTDDDGDYLELELSLTEGVRLQRQIFFAREDQFLFLCDVIFDAPAAISYRGTLPLAEGAAFVGAEESREGVLHVGAAQRRVALMMPLALPEWRADPRHGQLTASANAIELQQQAAQARLACPLFIDLDRRRFAKEFTWRQLTVAEKLEIQSPEVAVGYRVQSGSDQWLFYRSLGPRGNRTVLGQNLISEFLCARFDEGGDVEHLLEIEGSEEE